MISCDICGKTFNYNCQLMRHLEKKFPCQQRNVTTTPTQEENDKQCMYCQKILSTPYTLIRHEKTCKMKEDDVRQLENQLEKDVSLEPDTNVCRFCNKNFFNRRNLKRHDGVCKSKKEYKNALMEEIDARTTTINNTTNNTTNNNTTNNNTTNNNTTNNNTTINIFNNTMDWNDTRAMVELLEQIIPLESIKYYTRTGDVAVSLGDIARKYYEHNDSVQCTNLKTNTVKCRENGKFISRDADYVNTQNIEPMIHRVQDATYDGVLVPNIDDYDKLDRLTRQDKLTKEERSFLRKVLDEQKRAMHRTTIEG